MPSVRATAVAIVVAVFACVDQSDFTRVIALDAVAPNHFLGTCLDDVWVAQVEAQLGVSSKATDSQGRLEHPFLHRALSQPRFRVNDPRTASQQVFKTADVPEDAVIYGDGAQVDPKDATVVTKRGSVNGSLILELSGWTSHSLTTLVFSILAREVYGYPVAHYYVTDTLAITERMSSVRSGRVTPTHANLEVWIAGIEAGLQVYSNESFPVGGVGYFGRSGLYTSVDFIQDSLPLFANFWKSYEIHEELISAVPVSSLRNNSAFFPPAANVSGCANNSMGCLDHCSKTYACTLREQQTPAKECMVVVMMYDYFDPGYLQAALSNLNISTYFCFLGYDLAQEFVLDAHQRKQPVLFYHYEPDLFHINNKGLFDRVFLPRSVPERVALATGAFGEHGYGNRTDNPVDVDFPITKLSKYAASLLQNDIPLVRLLSQFSLSELDVNDLLTKYATASNANLIGTPQEEPDPTFRAACNWVQENYGTWSLWMERLPLCSFASHMDYDISGCETETIGGPDDEDAALRVVSFHWRQPHPGNTTRPYNCDGGMAKLPEPIYTSRSCEWLKNDPSRWASWVNGKPECDSKFYTYTISSCDANAKRSIQYGWLLPNPEDSSKSLECEGSEALPRPVEEECDYMPYSSSQFVAIASVDGILVAVLLGVMVFVTIHRQAAVIKRSQYELLMLTLVGGVLMCIAILVYAGPPTQFLCGVRPIAMSAGFTTIFGSLLVKSLRVYRVFMRTALRKTTVTVASMLRVFTAIFGVDGLIITAWYAVDFPAPTVKLRRSAKFDGSVTDLVCASTSFLFTAMLFFWKAIVLLVGIYISFLIRDVSTDFQESFWTFGSCIIVLVGCLVAMPIAYIVELAPSTFFIFLACILLVCTSLVMAFMVVPKLWRFRSAATVGRARNSVESMSRHAPQSVRSVGRADLSNMSKMSGADAVGSDANEVLDATPVMPIGPKALSLRSVPGR